MEIMMKDRINQLKKEKDAVVLAHYYVDGDVQDIADFVGDSYALAKQAALVSQKNIVFAGVKFMGESAKLLNAGKHVYMVDATAGCGMADMVTAEQVKRVKEEYPDAAVVCYVNSSAEVKAVSDVCVTSSNAVKVVKALEAKQIYFIPDQHLGSFVEAQVPEKEFIYHNGFCPIHKLIDEESLLKAKETHKEALVLAHPECEQAILKHADYIGSTADIIKFARTNTANEYIIATEIGVLHQLKKENPAKQFFVVNDKQVCHDMKKVTLAKLEIILKNIDVQEEVKLCDDIIESAKKPLEKMLDLAK
ncbi:MAG: quinolinate synthase NadA [Lachnospiraceae bacterium]|nr:quinolinate synthase NadA [Lachnospiraceae bacterium]